MKIGKCQMPNAFFLQMLFDWYIIYRIMSFDFILSIKMLIDNQIIII